MSLFPGGLFLCSQVEPGLLTCGHLDPAGGAPSTTASPSLSLDRSALRMHLLLVSWKPGVWARHLARWAFHARSLSE